MRKVQIKLPVKDWGTTKTKYPPDSVYVGPDEFTAGTQNIDTQLKGVITKSLGGVTYNPNSLLANPAVDQFEVIFSDGTHHLLVMQNGTLEYSSGNGVFNVVTMGYSPAGNMEFAQYLDRVYFDNGIDQPQVYDKNPTYGGVTYTVPRTKVMGAQTPTTAVTFAADTAGGNVPAGAHTYEVTFLYYGFEESNGGPASAVHTVVNPNNTVHLTSVPIGGYGVTARKIYRDNNDGIYELVGQINDNTTTTFTDTALTGTTPIPASNNTPPEFTLITNFLSRLWLAGVPGSPSTIFFSNAGLPDIFDPLNFLVCNPTDPIQAIVIYLDQLIVLNRHSVGVITGTSSTTFAYSDIEIGIGCVDNRSVQVRTIEGVPKLIWLSDKGFYQYNGASFEYMSDDIEDLVNFNIAQGQVVKGHNSQDTETDFSAGSFTPSIDITSNPGFIEQTSTSKTFQSELDWESGTLTNISTHDGTNTIKVPTQFAPLLANGTFNGTVQSGNTLTLGQGGNFTGESSVWNGAGNHAGVVITHDDTQTWSLAQPIIPTLTGTFTSCTFSVALDSHIPWTFVIWSDLFGIPNTQLFTQSLGNGTQDFGNPIVYHTYNITCSVPMTGGTKYYFGFTSNVSLSGFNNFAAKLGNTTFTGGHLLVERSNTTTWENAFLAAGGPALDFPNFASSYSYAVTPVQESGQWTSNIDDSFSDSVSGGMSITLTGSYPINTSSMITINGSNNSSMTPITTSQTFSNVNGTVGLGISGARYWQLVITLSTTDDRNVPVVNPPTLQFSITGTWISPAIDRTTDVVSDDHLNIVDTIPTGTNIVITVATSADNITYTSFVTFGTEIVQRYMKIRAILTAKSDDTITPFVTSLETDWTLTGTFTSSIIDTGANPPAGWDVFQSSFLLNGGTISFFFRSASTSGGIPGAVYQPVTNGSFPSNTPLEFCQWKAVLTSNVTNHPEIDSVTVNWFLSITQSSRVASIFYNRNYYIAAEELGQSHNDIVIVLDDRNKWRIYRGITINAFSFFFNSPFYSDALTGRVIKWLQGDTNEGTPIELFIYTKAFDFAIFEKTKILRKVYVKLKNTGAVYNFSYSVDDGITFLPMLVETQGGSLSLTTTNDGKLVFHRLLPVTGFTENSNKFYGKTIMFRIHENTVAEVEFHELKAEAWIREGELVETI